MSGPRLTGPGTAVITLKKPNPGVAGRSVRP
jgi:hypothetical protein